MNHRKTGVALSHDRSTQGHSKLSRRVFIVEIMGLLLGLVLFLQACDRVEATKERGRMSMTKTDSVPSMARPPIDASAPAKTETATFALG